jgi:hypothetical protein
MLVEEARVTGIDPAWHKIENRSVVLGRPFSLIDNQEARYVCLINPGAKEKLHLDMDCIGQTIMVADFRFTIVGVVESQINSSMFGGRQSGGIEVYIPFPTLIRIRGKGWMSVVANAKSPGVAEEAQAEIEFFLRGRRHIKPGEPNTFEIQVVSKFLEDFNKLARTMTLVATGIVGVSLLVGGVGIMNIMLVSVSERTREIGLRKAIGARPTAILLQFLIEAMTLCFLGGLLGLGGGHLLARLLASLPGATLSKAQIPFWAVALAFGSSQPPVETVVRFLEGTKFDTGLKLGKLFEIADYFDEVRKTRGFERGVTRINDMQVYDHQVPGGMISNLVSQLKEQRALHRLSEVLEEIPKVRADLGFPPLVTPTSQIVGIQAVLNV